MVLHLVSYHFFYLKEEGSRFCGLASVPNKSVRVPTTAAFLTGVDITSKIEDMVKSGATQKKRKVDINKWANDWVAFSQSIVSTVISFIKDLNFSSKSSTAYEAARTVKKRPKSDFDLLFDSLPNKALKSDGPTGNKCLEDEMNLFQKLREPNLQPLNYWKNEHRFSLLKSSAKIVLAIPVSFAAVERLFSAVGLLLSKLQRRMIPAIVINSVYIIFACKIKIKKMVQEFPGSTELSETVDEQEIDTLLNEQSDSDNE